MTRYIIADADSKTGGGWTHIFLEGRRQAERETRFVWDRKEEKLLALDIKRARVWHRGSRAEFADLEDSLLNANPDALENPAEWGLDATNCLPAWAPAIGDLRYVVADADAAAEATWTHSIVSDEGDVDHSVRFAFDREESRVVAMQVRRGDEWQPATEEEIADLCDDLNGASSDAILKPKNWLLLETNELPLWAPTPDVETGPSL